ncbi:MAG: VCBS repeat-containing protein [Acidimicrobiia bacterium]|nr:VCBS repeat-containing protein [Acidimicrobiia bacterium]
MRKLRWVLAAGVIATVVPVATSGVTSGATPVREPNSAAARAPLDCTNWRYGVADEPTNLPAEFDRNNYKRTSLRDPALATSPHHLCGQKGSAVDLAWGVQQGRPDVRIAVLDSGIKWRDAGAMADLANRAYLNRGELHPPCAVPSGDCNSDGRFSIADFGAIPDRNGNGLADPEDLILDPAVSNGVDDDHNGYVDDISGWDFLYGDNNPLDTVDYGHGTGEAEDSTAAANGSGDVGTCPNCTFIPVRVGDSFIADGGRFAAGVLFGLDSGAAVIQEALGGLNNPRQAQQAIDAAYRRGVPVIASMADEASKHPNLPGSLEHTLTVNSVRDTGSPRSYLALNGCTNFGGRTFLSVPSSSCSSEATGIMSGVAGLVVSEARDRGLHLSTNEILQLVRTAADDVDFSTPNAVDPANDFLSGSTVRYPTTAGWDGTNGYGRLNAYELLKAVRDDRIPPEADLTGPQWFDVLPTTGTLRITGHVGAPKARAFAYRVEWAVGMQPPAYPGTDTWHVVGGKRHRTRPKDGTLARLDLATVAAELAGATGPPANATTGRTEEEKFSVRIRVVTTAIGGPTAGLIGESQKQVFVHDDPDLMAGMPRRIRGAGTSSPVFYDLEPGGGQEMILATDDGTVHAYRSDQSELPGFPVRTGVAPYWVTGRTALEDGIAPARGAIMVGAPVIADLDGDGSPDLAVGDLEGRISAWDRFGNPLPGFEHTQTLYGFSLDNPIAQDSTNRTQRGFANSLAAGDLDGDGHPELVGAALDRHVYAWHGDGTPVAGFPVLVVDPAKVQAVNGLVHKVTFTPDSGVGDGGELVSTPALADLTGDGRPEIIVGAQEEYDEAFNAPEFAGLPGTSGNSREYVISPDGRNATNPNPNRAHPDAQAYLPGWPVKVGLFQREVLPLIGNGVSAQAAVGELVPGHPGKEIVFAAAVGPIYVFGVDGRSALGQVDGKDVPLHWFGGLFANDPTGTGARRNSDDIGVMLAAFGGPSVGKLGARDHLDVAAPTSGLSRLLDTATPELQLPSDDQLAAWDPVDGTMRAAFPRETPDLAFFVTPAIADVNGDKRPDVVAGNGVYTLSAVSPDGTIPPGWPKLTGGWLVGTPGLGDWDGDGTAELAVVRRDGVLLVWHTPTPSTRLRQWPRFGQNAANTGSR